MPVSAAALPLPSGAATAANQPTNAAQASTTSGQTGHLAMGAVSTSAPSYTNAQTDPLSLDTAGNVRVNCATGCSTPSANTPAIAGSAASSLVLKASAGNLYSAYVNSTVQGYLMVFNAVSAPANGATTAGTASGNMVECIGPSITPYLAFSGLPPEAYSVGITAVFSTTGCATLTASATAFIHGQIQ
jgi:hypothetical protein